MNHRLEHVIQFFERDLTAYYGVKDVRNAQIQMAIDVAGMLSPSSKFRTLIVDAPVGTGKTFAALVPALFDRKRLIYSTSSLNLQSQLKTEELHYLQEHGEVRRFIVAKGVTHYICQNRIENSSIHGKDLMKNLFKFCANAVEGDRIEFETNFGSISDDHWNSISLKANKDCKFCEKKFSCPTASHRSKFNSLSIDAVVTNHNQLIQSVINVHKDISPIIDFRLNRGIIIIDEAHDFMDAALGQLSEKLTIHDLNKANKGVNNNREKASIYVNALYSEVKRLKQELDVTRGRHPVPDNCQTALLNLNELFNQEISSSMATRLSDNPKFRVREEESSLEHCVSMVNHILDTKNYTAWFELDENNGPCITVVKNTFRGDIRTLIRTLVQSNHLIFMSGTLAISGSFDPIFYDWGGQPWASKTLALDTVFDYPNQAMLYVPHSISKPISTRDESYISYCEELKEEILKLIEITGGRTLILCTSHKQMDILHTMLKPILDSMDIMFLKQGVKSIELLTEDFKRYETSVLIGSGSFFAGLSVPGKSLISVILCRLPFPPPTDPFLDLIAEGMSRDEKMEDIEIPRMLIRLQQAGGRLIRTIEDFGCFSILDPRVYDRQYSKRILQLLFDSGYRFTRDRRDVDLFIKSRMDIKGFAKYPPYVREELKVPESLRLPDKPRDEQSRIPSVPLLHSTLPTENIKINQDQIEFYKTVRKIAKRSEKIKSIISDPFELFLDLLKLEDEKNLNLNIIGTFPYVSEQQQSIFVSKYRRSKNTKNSKVITTKCSPEEIEEMIKKATS